MKIFQAVLFDYDGVVADTMEDNFMTWKSAFKTIGIGITRDDYFPLEGMNPDEIASIILKRYGLTPDFGEEIVKLKQEYYLSFTKTKQIRIYPHIIKSLKFLRNKKVPTGLVTGAARERLESSISEVINFFNIVITANDTFNGRKIKGKPSPDPYLAAAKRLKVPVKKCLAVENAPYGIQSAKSAGCYCLALTTTMFKDKLKGADQILNNHQEMYNQLRKFF